MKIFTKNDTEFTPDGIMLGDRCFGGYKGITKICYWGEESLFSKISKRIGEKEARKVLDKSSARGNKVHEHLETNFGQVIKKEDLALLGQEVGHEVFLYGDLFGVNALGFADAIFYNEETDTYTIVDYKTKSCKSSWTRYGDLVKYWIQLTGYALLFNKMYEAQNINLAVYVIFNDTMKYEPYYLTIKQAKPYAIMLNKKCQLIKT